MPKPTTHRKDLYLERMLETRSHAWEKVGLAGQVRARDLIVRGFGGVA
jgi:hypothetical protein